MCRKSSTCILLGEDSQLWSKEAPLPVPKEIQDYLPLFIESLKEIIAGNRSNSLSFLSRIDSDAAREFFVEHGQQSAYFRVVNRKEIDGLNRAKKSTHSTQRLSASLEKKAFERDGYRCRYCALPIIDKSIFKEFSRVVGAEHFSVEKKNSKRHGITLIFRGVADHLEPFAHGGETVLENLVTSCYSCNFGKAGYTIKEMQISNPLDREPIIDGKWSGALEFLKPLRLLSTNSL